MSRTHQHNYWIVGLKHASGAILESPLLFPTVVSPVRPREPSVLASLFADKAQRRWVETGDYLTMLRMELGAEVRPRSLDVSLPPAKQGLLYPELKLCFHYAEAALPEGRWIAFVPVLGVEAVAETREELRNNLEDFIRLDLARNRSLKSVSRLLATQWYSGLSVRNEPVSLTYFNFNELEELRKEKKEPWLPRVAERLNATLAKAFGMDSELEQLRRALTGRFAGSVLVIGPTGVGKSALVNEAARRRDELGLGELQIWEGSAPRLLQRLMDEQGWQKNLASLCGELRDSDKLLYLHNLADLFEVGRYEGNATSMAEFLRGYLERGELRLLAECTDEEVSTIDARYPGYSALFQSLRLVPPTVGACNRIVTQKVAWIAAQEGAEVTDDAVAEILRLHRRYQPYSGYPGKTIRFLESLVRSQEKGTQDRPALDRTTVIGTFCEETGMPRYLVDPQEPLHLEQVEAFLGERIKGQADAQLVLSNLLAAVKTGLARPGKPIASLMFVGPTGVGKTEMAKALAELVFGDPHRMIRFDMSEFSDSGSVLRLTGDVRADSAGLLTARVRQEPFSVILFDEIEKADPAFYDLLLQMTGEGRLTDARGRVADFCSTLVILTSNIGAGDFGRGGIGFMHRGTGRREAARHFQDAVRDFFRPELFNRLDEVVAFSPLGRAVMRSLVERELKELSCRRGLRERRKMDVAYADTMRDEVARAGYETRYGARHLQRAVRDRIALPLARAISAEWSGLPVVIRLASEQGKLDVQVRHPPHSHDKKREQGQLDHEISEVRRVTQQVLDGPYYIRLLSELDILERKKRKRKDAFWASGGNTRRFKVLHEYRRQFQSQVELIEELEAQMLARLFQVKTPGRQPEALLNEYQEGFHRLQVRLYELLAPSAAYCTLGVYGEDTLLETVAGLYLDIASAKGFAVEAKIVGFDPNPRIAKPEKRFSRFDYPPKQPDQLPPHWIGIEIGLQGECVFPYFQDESGLQRWMKESIDQALTSNKEGNFSYLIAVENARLADFRTPAEAHRRSFFQSRKARREIYADCFKDKTYGMERKGGIHATLLSEILDQRWSARLQSLLIKGDD